MRGGNKVQLIILLVTLVASLALSNAPHVKHDSQLAHLPEHFVGESFSGPILLPENNVSPAPDFDPYYQIFRINKIILSIVENNEKIRNINDVEEKLDNMASTASEEFYKDTPLDNFNRPKLKEGLKKEMHKHWRLENGKIFLEENFYNELRDVLAKVSPNLFTKSVKYGVGGGNPISIGFENDEGKSIDIKLKADGKIVDTNLDKVLLEAEIQSVKNNTNYDNFTIKELKEKINELVKIHDIKL